MQGFYRPSNSLIRSACTICYILNKSTTYKVSKYLKTLLYVKELTCYEAMNIERCLYQKSNSIVVVSSAILKISITNISPDAESHEEQDGANHFLVHPKMTELWRYLCVNVGEKKEERLFLFV